MPADLRESLLPLLHARGELPARLVAVRGGWEADCFVLEGAHGEQLLVKAFRGAGLEGEVAAMQRVHAQLDGHGEVHAPAVLDVLPRQNAFVMEVAPGVTTHALVVRPRLPAGWHPLLARRLIDGLEAVYDAIGGPHGDFHPGNMLITPALEPWFIDLVGVAAGGSRAEWAALDIGTWAYKAVSRIPRAAAVLPYAVARHLMLARAVLEEAASRFAGGDVPGFRMQVARHSREHLAALAASEWPRDRLAAAAGSRLLRLALGGAG